jgi:hypothetical protein
MSNEKIQPVTLSAKPATGERIEQCCNYEIRGEDGERVVQNSPTHRLMSAMRDTGVSWS